MDAVVTSILRIVLISYSVIMILIVIGRSVSMQLVLAVFGTAMQLDIYLMKFLILIDDEEDED